MLDQPGPLIVSLPVKAVAQDLAIGVVTAFGHQAVEIRRVGGLDCVEAATIDADQENLFGFRTCGTHCAGNRAGNH